VLLETYSLFVVHINGADGVHEILIVIEEVGKLCILLGLGIQQSLVI
jgi:hypothetical protein